MVYKGYKILADVETWDTYDVNDDGTLGDFIRDGGGDTEYPNYTVWSLDEDGEDDEQVSESSTVEGAKFEIDQLIKKATEIQDEQGN